LHEEVSDGIFDEINNVIHANRALSRGQQRFFFGAEIYYRVYAERQHVVCDEETAALMMAAGYSQFYAPFLYWALSLPPRTTASVLASQFLNPKSPYVNHLIRTAMLLGPDFCVWLHGKFKDKWGSFTQPSQVYWTLESMISKAKSNDPRLAAARISSSKPIKSVDEISVDVKELLAKPELAAAMLSHMCMRVFEGQACWRAQTRELDYIAYGLAVMQSAHQIADAMVDIVGNKLPGDVSEYWPPTAD